MCAICLVAVERATFVELGTLTSCSADAVHPRLLFRLLKTKLFCAWLQINFLASVYSVPSYDNLASVWPALQHCRQKLASFCTQDVNTEGMVANINSDDPTGNFILRL